MARCALCRVEGELRESHIVPRFAAKWLRNTSPTGRFRDAANPNLVAQDIQKARLLCHGCEQRFGAWEKSFAEQVFQVWHEEAVDDPEKLMSAGGALPQDPAFALLAVSLAWRAATVERSKHPPTLSARPLYDEALDEWAHALQSSQPSTPRSSHAIIQAGPLAQLMSSLQLRGVRHRYILRACDIRVSHQRVKLTSRSSGERLDERHILGVFTKLPGFGFFSLYGFPPNETRLSSEMRDAFLAPALLESSSQLASYVSRMTPRQLRLACEQGARDAASGQTSLALRCAMADFEELRPPSAL